MKNTQRLENEGLSEFADRMAMEYKLNNSRSSKKGKGQFFTSLSISKFMANLAVFGKNKVSILDPGAGTGILSVALIENLIKNKAIKEIILVCYETDTQVLPYLKKVLEETRSFLRDKSISFEYSILNADFIVYNADVLTTNLRTFNKEKFGEFDIIISNPPYFKLNKSDVRIAKFKDIVSGQPNIYFLFMAISARLLNEPGEMIFITPRSFCSGLYYSKFRKWLIQKVNFSHIHLFDSRKKLFSGEGVLQENVITKFTKKEQDQTTISKSSNAEFSDVSEIRVLKKDILYKSNGHIFFRIPSSNGELDVIRELDKLPCNFYKLGIKISTGKVVAFRNRKYLANTLSEDSVPLLWMHNIKEGKVRWPLSNKNKPIAIKRNEVTQKLLLPAGDYLILKRFTTKEQKKRFDSAIISQEDFHKYRYFALDNKVNYIYGPHQKLTKNQISGIARYLNMPIVELYFRILNGHTQVNANEVYALPFPSLDQLERLGAKGDIGYSEMDKQALSNIKQNQTESKEMHAGS